MNQTQFNHSIYFDLPPGGFMRAKEIHRYLGIGLSTWWYWVRTGKVPAGIRLGPRTTVWRTEDIRKLLIEMGEAQ